MPTLPSFSLSATLTPSAPVPGGLLTATITAVNSGSALTGGILTITLPAGVVEAVTVSAGTWTISGPTLTVTLGAVASPQTVTVTATIEAAALGAATVSASVAADQGTAGPATATVTVADRRLFLVGMGRLKGRPSRMQPGVYSLYKSFNNNMASLPAGIVGILFQTSWNAIETAKDTFDWSSTDAVIAQAASRGLTVSLSLGTGGGQIPTWLPPLCSTFTYINTSVFQASAGQSVTIPLPWDATCIARKVNFVKQAGLRYASNPAITAVMIDACSCGQANDWFWPNYQGNYTMPDSSVVALDQVADWVAAGYTTAKAFGAAQQLIDAAAASFPARRIKHPVANADPDLESSPNLDVSPFTLGHMVESYGAGRWPGLFLPQWNRLKVTTPAPTDPTVTGAFLDSSKYKYTIMASLPKRHGWQAADSCSKSDNSRMNGGTAGDPVTVLTNALAVAEAYGSHFIELWNQDAIYPAFATPIQAATNALRKFHAAG